MINTYSMPSTSNSNIPTHERYTLTHPGNCIKLNIFIWFIKVCAWISGRLVSVVQSHTGSIICYHPLYNFPSVHLFWKRLGENTEPDKGRQLRDTA